MAKTVEFIFDFGSPNAYLANRILPELSLIHISEPTRPY